MKDFSKTYHYFNKGFNSLLITCFTGFAHNIYYVSLEEYEKYIR